MKLTISYKNVKHSEAVEDRIKEKTYKLEKYLGPDTVVKWTCYSKDHTHWAEILVFGQTFEYHAKAHHENLYKSFDLVTAKIYKQLSKKKELWKNKIHTKRKRPEIVEPDMVWTDYPEDYDYDKVG
jgi:putative sigma-54 modulation protein